MADNKKDKAKKKSNEQFAKSALIIMVAIVSGFFGGWFGSQSQVANNETTITRQIVESEGSLINTIATDVSPSVVSVNVTSAGITQDYFGFGQQVESQSAGTGVILSAEGLIITNRHVVPIETTVVTVTLSS
jgi:serine protease Do